MKFERATTWLEKKKEKTNCIKLENLSLEINDNVDDLQTKTQQIYHDALFGGD